MKKLFTLVTLIALLSLTAVSVLAEAPAPVSVTVTVSVAGELKTAAEAVTVTDADGDGALTVNDALVAVHVAKHPSGAEGYASYQSQYGLSIARLWGDESGSVGYYLNDASCMSLLDPVKEGDRVAAFVYKDTAAWSDTYCYFDRSSLSCEAGESVTLTLTSVGFDANWNPVTLPVENAVITVNGVATSHRTDAEGKVTFTPEGSGRLVISATSEAAVLVPPVCVLELPAVTEAATNAPATQSPTTGGSAPEPYEVEGCGSSLCFGAILLSLLSGAALTLSKKERSV